MKRIAGSALAILAVLSGTESRTIFNLAKANGPYLPSHNLATPKFTSWLSAFNTADRNTILSFYSTNFIGYNETTCASPSSRIRSPCQHMHLASWTGGFELVDLEASANDSSLTVLLQEKNSPRYFRASVVVDEEKPEHLIMELDLHPIMTPLTMIPNDDPRRKIYEKGLQPLTKELREKLVLELARLLREEYVYPRQGEAMIEVLEKNLKNGKYDSFDDSDKFSRQLSIDLRSETSSADGQLFVFFHEPPFDYKKETLDQHRNEYFRKIQYGFGNVSFDTEAIPGKAIATLHISELLPLDEPGVREAVGTKMNMVAHADVLILDLRDSFGLDSKTAAFVLSYLFAEPRRLTYSVDRYDMIRNSSSTFPLYQLPEGAKIFGGEKPIYVLTNNRTMYHAEGIAYSLQAFNRGTIVGEQETTGGWANFEPMWFPICEREFGKEWWSVHVQSRRLVHDVTKASWEGVGVKSDLKLDWTGGEATNSARESAIAFEKSRMNVWEVQQEL